MKTYALITGSSSGIGKAIAIELARRHFNILLVALPGTGLPELTEELKRTFSVDVRGFETDLTDMSAPQKIIDWIKEEKLVVQILVNNAGFGNLCALEKTDPAQIANMILLNNQSLVLLTRLLIPLLKRNRNSYLMNVGSLASFMPVPNKALYAATKSFVYAFSGALRLELKKYRIHVSCLCPGGTLTNKGVAARIEASGAGSMFIQMPDEVAMEAIQKMFEGKFRIIPGWHNKLFYSLKRWLPESWQDILLIRLFGEREVQVASKQWAQSSFRTFALAYR